jgi:hypothetical protein
MKTITVVLLAAILLVLVFGRDVALDMMGVVAVFGVMTITAFTIGQIISDHRH